MPGVAGPGLSPDSAASLLSGFASHTPLPMPLVFSLLGYKKDIYLTLVSAVRAGARALFSRLQVLGSVLVLVPISPFTCCVTSGGSLSSLRFSSLSLGRRTTLGLMIDSPGLTSGVDKLSMAQSGVRVQVNILPVCQKPQASSMGHVQLQCPAVSFNKGSASGLGI